MDKKQQFSVWYVLAVFLLLLTFQGVFLGPHTETLDEPALETLRTRIVSASVPV